MDMVVSYDVWDGITALESPIIIATVTLCVGYIMRCFSGGIGCKLIIDTEEIINSIKI